MNKNILLFFEKNAALILYKFITEYTVISISDYNKYEKLFDEYDLTNYYKKYFKTIYKINQFEIFNFNESELTILKLIYEEDYNSLSFTYNHNEKYETQQIISRIEEQIKIIQNCNENHLCIEKKWIDNKLLWNSYDYRKEYRNKYRPKRYISVSICEKHKDFNTQFFNSDKEISDKLIDFRNKLLTEFEWLTANATNYLHSRDLDNFLTKYSHLNNDQPFKSELKNGRLVDILEEGTIFIREINQNEILWTSELINKHKDFFNFQILYEYIEPEWQPYGHKKEVDYTKYGWHYKDIICLDFNFIKIHKDKLDWGFISSYSKLNWTDDLLFYFKDYLVFTYKYYDSGSNKKDKSFKLNRISGTISEAIYIDWTEDKIELLIDYLDFKLFCLNESVKWSNELIEKYEKQINFISLSANKSITWDSFLINRYKDKIGWQSLSSNPSIIWTDELIREFKLKIRWNEFCLNSNFPINSDFLMSFDDELNWDAISSNPNIIWNESLINKYVNKINFWNLSKYGIINAELIYIFQEKFTEIKLINRKFQKNSDWSPHEHKTYYSSFQNLLTNKNFILEINDSIKLSAINFKSQYGFVDSGISEEITTEDYNLLQYLKNIKLSNLNWDAILNNSQIDYFINKKEKNNSKTSEFLFINDSIWNDFIKLQITNEMLVDFLNELNSN